MEQKIGCCHLYYGDGKGKTTAAVGLAVRARGQGLPVLFVQFLKSDKSGELEPLRQLGVQVFSGPADQKFTFTMNEEEKAECARQQNRRFACALEAMEQQPAGLLVLDEVIDAAEKSFLEKAPLLQLLARHPGWELVLTGHSAPAWAADAADYITRLQAERHPYQKGLAARRGIEY